MSLVIGTKGVVWDGISQVATTVPLHQSRCCRNVDFRQEYTPETEGRVIVVSHQWLSWDAKW